MRSARTWARSKCACCVSQVSALPPKTLDRRTAISGEIPRFSLTSSDIVVRVTPRAAAACVMVKPKGSIHWRSTKPPGCGGFFIGMVQAPSVVIDIINLQRVALHQAENHPPVGAHRHRPKAFELALERMQPAARPVHVRDRIGSIQTGENVFRGSPIFHDLPAARRTIARWHTTTHTGITAEPDHHAGAGAERDIAAAGAWSIYQTPSKPHR